MPVVVITTTGSGSWTVPAGVNAVYAEAWGGGGLGDGSTYYYGGGGGAYSADWVVVTPGQTLNYFVAAPQTGVTVGGIVGQDSWFDTPTTVLAKGAQKASGGLASSGYGSVKFSGGDGDGDSGGGSASPYGDGAAGDNGWERGGDSPNAGLGARSGNAPGEPARDAQSHPDGGGGGTEWSKPAPGSPGGGAAGEGSVALQTSRGQIRLTYEVAIVRTIASNFDDGFYTGAGGSSISTLVNGVYGGEPSRAYLRFLDITVPQGAGVASAILRLTVQQVYGTAWGSFRGVAADSALSVGVHSLGDLVSTAQSTPIASAPIGSVVELDVTNIVQAIVNRPGWVSGNALAFLGDVTGADDEIYWDDFSDTVDGRPSLTITLGDAAPGDTTPPTITSAATGSVQQGVEYSLNLTADEVVTWSKVSGAGEVSDTVLTYPGSLLAGTYETVVQATDASGNDSQQTHTLIVTPGDSGGPGTPGQTDWKTPGALASIVDGNRSWQPLTPANLSAVDGAIVRATGINSTAISHVLRSSDFGFTAEDVPADATITGVEIELVRRRSFGSGVPFARHARLSINSTGTLSDQIGQNNNTDVEWTNSFTTAPYGGVADMWGAELTPALIQNSLFGFDYGLQGGAASMDAAVEQLRMRVHFTTPGSPAPTRRAPRSFHWL